MASLIKASHLESLRVIAGLHGKGESSLGGGKRLLGTGERLPGLVKRIRDPAGFEMGQVKLVFGLLVGLSGSVHRPLQVLVLPHNIPKQDTKRRMGILAVPVFLALLLERSAQLLYSLVGHVDKSKFSPCGKAGFYTCVPLQFSL